MTLTEALHVRGFTHRPAEGLQWVAGRHDVVDASGRIVFTGHAHEVWAWLRGVELVVLEGVA